MRIAIDRLSSRWTTVLIVFVAVLCYANSLTNGFVQDDMGIIYKHPLVPSLSALWRAWTYPYWPDWNGAGQYRPLIVISFAIDHALFGWTHWWYHFVNVCWHAGICVLVWRLLRQMLEPAGALFGALWFATQPVHVEAISNGVGRCELMASAFVLLGYFAHRRGQKLAILWYALALASKESGIVMLGLAVAGDLIFSERPLEEIKARRPLYDGYVAVLLVYAGAIWYVFQHRHFVVEAITWTHATPLQRNLTMLRVVPEYFRLLLAPVDLKIDYTPPVISMQNGLTPGVLVGAALVIASVAVVVLTWRRQKAVAFGFAWFVIAISPVANVLFGSGVVLAERTLYLPSVGAAIIAGWVMDRVLPVRRRVALALATMILVAFGVRGWMRTPFWHDKRMFLIDEAAEQPDSFRAHYAVCELYMTEKHYLDALGECRRARILYPSDIGPYITGAQVAMLMANYPLADVLLDTAVHKDPNDHAGLRTLAQLRAAEHRYRESMALALAAYEVSPDSVSVIDELTLAAYELRDFASADAAYRRGLFDHPDNVHLRRSYANMLMDRGDTAAARRQIAIATMGAVGDLLTPQGAMPRAKNGA